jgi:hypothetical protein
METTSSEDIASPTMPRAGGGSFAPRHTLPALTAPGRAALVIPLATFPLVYYVVSNVAHYPAPLVWLLLLLAAYEVQSWIHRGSDTCTAAHSYSER